MPSRRRERAFKGNLKQQQHPAQVTRRSLKEKLLQKSANRHASQIAALKANNNSLAAALDEVRQESRLLQGHILELQEERQQLLEKVVSLESQLAQKSRCKNVQPAVKLLGEADQKIQRAMKILDSKTAHETQPASGKMVCILSPVADEHKSAVSPPCSNKTVYRRTPYPTTRPAQGSTERQFTSTPMFTDSQSLPMLITPCAIHFSESEVTACHTKVVGSESSARQCRQTRVSPTEGKEPRSSDNSPGLPEGGSRASQPPEWSQHTGLRPKRRCTSLYLSYQEPNLITKLRRGDPHTENSTDWIPRNKPLFRRKVSTKLKHPSKKMTSMHKQVLGIALKDITNQ